MNENGVRDLSDWDVLLLSANRGIARCLSCGARSGAVAVNHSKQRDRIGGVEYPQAPTPSFLFDLDGTLIDSVYQHVIAWREALSDIGIDLSVWRIHRRIGMSGGLFVHALLRETGRTLSAEEIIQLQQAHAVTDDSDAHDDGQVVLVHDLHATPAGRCRAGAHSAVPVPSSPGSHRA